MDKKGFYALLKIPPTAGDREIKDAFRREVKLFHPDRNPDPKAAEIYLKINEAYQVLTDPEARRAYDNVSDGGTDFVPCSRCGIHSKQPRYILFDEGGLFTSGVFCRACASKQQFRSALKNWENFLRHPIRAFRGLRNNRALGEKPAGRNMDMLLQNAAAFRHEKRIDVARFLAEQALKFARDSAERSRVSAFMAALPEAPKRREPDYWRIKWTDTFRVYFPLFMVLIVWAVIVGTPYLKAWIEPPPPVVADYKPLPVIPLRFDISDTDQLFHTYAPQTPVYQAPCLDCGIIDLLPAETSVRLTGLVPQTDWVQVMTPLGRVVFVKTTDLRKGLGKAPLPYRSKITPSS